ncbi:hypothetical protein [Sulfuriflexus mobilis]|uniref:hypothetical protein n=1 Tax=Sulfuriflexus mobilis TaxID=1811807 RepID=UPI000F81B5F5|nr:hypothetical protein [Sulfuriflexus mobilis]
MKSLLLVIALIGGGYYIYNNHSPFQTEVTDPHFIEIRVAVDNTNIKLVGFGKMFSQEDCLARSAKIWVNVFKEAGKLNLVDTNCSKTLPGRYEKLFDNKPIAASYLVFEKGNNRERDGRFIFYGIPSSYVAKECDKLIARAKKNYRGKVYCVQGTIG